MNFVSQSYIIIINWVPALVLQLGITSNCKEKSEFDEKPFSKGQYY